ncbi:hypothetical protein RSOL_155950 [Rhizoctonia solani AG-3 Rhs1AP]|uniref:Uncharacterized protein n=1 Tax=Rhizoctonia solani AG-3 Rhs1AP TaxID=1086054 RepID=X8J3G3_9AGAM|nr:hypothetical protein RSOL_155950 [Rhizoctonia solani AG-3 Rhs1AP]
MATSLHPHSSNPFRDANRTPTVTPQTTGASTNPFLHPAESLSPQGTGASQYFTPQPTGALSSQATGAYSTQIEPHSSPRTDSYAPTSPPAPTYAPPSGPPPQQSTYAPPPGPPPQPRAPSPTPTVNIEPPPPYTPAADVRHGEIPLETGPRRAYAPEWHPDGQAWRNEQVVGPSLAPPPPPAQAPRAETQWDSLLPTWTRPSSSSPNLATQSQSWSSYPGLGRQASMASPPPRHPSQPNLGRANTTAGNSSSRVGPGPPTIAPTPGRALLNNGKVLAYPARYECNKCHLTGYVAYDPSNPCRECWSLFAQPYEGVLSFAPWESPESVMTDEQNLQRPLPASSSHSRPQQRPTPGPSRPLSHPQQSSFSRMGPPGSLPPQAGLHPRVCVPRLQYRIAVLPRVRWSSDLVILESVGESAGSAVVMVGSIKPWDWRPRRVRPATA